MKKLAVLIPVYNGGSLLGPTIESCARAGLDRASYEILVADNCSDDGSVERLPATTNIHRNPRNLGRVGNWNRSLEIAAEQGYTYATFLFPGDEWLPDGGIDSLIRTMDENESVLGMAALRIVNEAGENIREGGRISIACASANVAGRMLLRRAVQIGRLPFAPIQANVYRLFKDRPLRFDESAEKALNADIEATAQFLEAHPGIVTISSAPLLLWRERAERFFSTQDPWFVFADTRRSLSRISELTGFEVDWKSANAVAMLAAFRETSHAIPWRARLAFQWRVLRFLMADDAGLSCLAMLRFLVRKIVSGRSYLSLDASADAVHESALLHPVANECRY